MEIDSKKQAFIDLNKELSASELKQLRKIAKGKGRSPRQQATQIIFEYLAKEHGLDKKAEAAIKETLEEPNERR